MNLHELIVDCISHASANVFSTMLGVEIRQGEVSIENGTPDANDGVVSLIGLAGTWTGAGSISCTPALACRICAQMLMTESTAVDEEVLDAVAELTNMIIGSVKTDLEQHLGPARPEHPDSGVRPQFQDAKRRQRRMDRGALPLGRRVPAGASCAWRRSERTATHSRI